MNLFNYLSKLFSSLSFNKEGDIEQAEKIISVASDNFYEESEKVSPNIAYLEKQVSIINCNVKYQKRSGVKLAEMKLILNRLKSEKEFKGEISLVSSKKQLNEVF